MSLLADLQIVPFTTTPFTQWRSEWQEHIFCKSVNLYCIAMNNNYQTGENEVQTKSTFAIFLSTFYLHPLTITSCRMMTETLQQLAEAGSRSITPCQPISLISTMVLQP